MWFKIKDQQVEIRILAKPNAKKSALVMICDQELQISLHAKPQAGEANKALILYLANLFGAPKSKIILQSGKESRHKKIILPLVPTIQKFLDNPTALIRKKIK